MTEPKFMTPAHRRAYLTHLNRCKAMDSYHRALIYILTAVPALRNNISAMKFSAKHKKMRRKTALIYSEVERKEIEHVYGVFKDYIHASKFLDFVWSEKLGYLLLHIDPTENTIEEDQIITSADELCAELFNEVATDVFQEAKREHFYPDADDDEIAEIRRRWQPYLDLLPEYRSSCRAFHTAE